MFGWFLRKKEVDKIKEETKKGFDSVKKDIVSVSGWINHLNSEKDYQKKEILEIKEILSSIKEELEGVKNIVSILGETAPFEEIISHKQTNKRLFKKQTAVYPVQTTVQTTVQTPNLDLFSVTERAIIWVLLNTDMKLSHDDLAAILGKEKATIRGQISRIKQKGGGLIEEIIEKNNKKRLYIPEKVKEKLLKKTKVRVKTKKKQAET